MGQARRLPGPGANPKEVTRHPRRIRPPAASRCRGWISPAQPRRVLGACSFPCLRFIFHPGFKPCRSPSSDLPSYKMGMNSFPSSPRGHFQKSPEGGDCSQLLSLSLLPAPRPGIALPRTDRAGLPEWGTNLRNVAWGEEQKHRNLTVQMLAAAATGPQGHPLRPSPARQTPLASLSPSQEILGAALPIQMAGTAQLQDQLLQGVSAPPGYVFAWWASPSVPSLPSLPTWLGSATPARGHGEDPSSPSPEPQLQALRANPSRTSFPGAPSILWDCVCVSPN